MLPYLHSIPALLQQITDGDRVPPYVVSQCSETRHVPIYGLLHEVQLGRQGVRLPLNEMGRFKTY